MKFSYYVPTKIFFGEGSVSRLSRAKLPAGKGMIVTGGTSTTKLGYVAMVADALAQGGHETIVYDKVQPNPTIETVREASAIARENACSFIVGLGGGSAIDSAKAIACMATNDGDWWDYVFGGSGKGQRLKNEPLPIVAVTTTAGTGTEADPWTVITNGEEKIGAGFPDATFPTISIVDPALMMTVPAKLTAYQGFDALFHACEGYIAKIANPMSEMFSLKAVELIGKSLPVAVADGSNKQARAEVALANTMAGFVESLSACTSEHGIEHAMSGFHPDLPHGAGLIMISVEYYKVFAQVCPERLADLARALGRTDGDFVAALVELQEKCGVSQLKMSDYGLDNTDFGKYADHAFADMGGTFKVDRTTLTRDDVIGILDRSYR